MEQRRILLIFQARLFIHLDMLLMQQDVINSDLLCVTPSSHIFFSSQCYPHPPVSLCFAEITLSSNPVLQLSEGELQILCCLQYTDLLNRKGDRMYLLQFDTKLLKATRIFLLTSFISTHASSIKEKVSFACLEKRQAILPLKFTTDKRYHIYCFLIHKTCCSTIKAKQIELLSNFFGNNLLMHNILRLKWWEVRNI